MRTQTQGFAVYFLVTSIVMCFVSSVKHGQQGQTAMITGKKTSKKYYDKSGNLVTDKDLIKLNTARCGPYQLS
jgi:hypothetical protein